MNNPFAILLEYFDFIDRFIRNLPNEFPEFEIETPLLMCDASSTYLEESSKFESLNILKNIDTSHRLTSYYLDKLIEYENKLIIAHENFSENYYEYSDRIEVFKGEPDEPSPAIFIKLSTILFGQAMYLSNIITNHQKLIKELGNIVSVLEPTQFPNRTKQKTEITIIQQLAALDALGIKFFSLATQKYSNEKLSVFLAAILNKNQQNIRVQLGSLNRINEPEVKEFVDELLSRVSAV